jgi:hypothetical protein
MIGHQKTAFSTLSLSFCGVRPAKGRTNSAKTEKILFGPFFSGQSSPHRHGAGGGVYRLPFHHPNGGDGSPKLMGEKLHTLIIGLPPAG